MQLNRMSVEGLREGHITLAVPAELEPIASDANTRYCCQRTQGGDARPKLLNSSSPMQNSSVLVESERKSRGVRAEVEAEKGEGEVAGQIAMVGD